METIKFINRILADPLIISIWVYQQTLSPDHGPLKNLYPHGVCKFYPSCSMFAKEILARQGIKACPKIIKRILSCNPWSLGGIDLPQYYD